jgi:hypothetical protein
MSSKPEARFSEPAPTYPNAPKDSNSTELNINARNLVIDDDHVLNYTVATLIHQTASNTWNSRAEI